MAQQPRIDDTTFTSPAIRELADREPALIEARDAVTAQSRGRLAAMTKPQIIEALREDAAAGKVRNVNDAERLGKAALVDAVAEVYGDASDAGRELARLRRRARADWRMAHEVNTMIDRAEELLSTLHGDSDLYNTGHNIRAYAAQFQTAIAVVRNYAQVLVSAVADGEDIHAVARRLLDNAVKTIGAFPNSVAAGSGTGTEQAHDAAAAKAFIHAYTWTYGGVGEEYLNISLALLI